MDENKIEAVVIRQEFTPDNYYSVFKVPAAKSEGTMLRGVWG